ncbi:elongation factor Ts [Candidatus Dojkabacteria bacterium]|uniref:Elongation factor Ts n=1 Tax=Candidatus Dojkabacteria bacterium TaxID=2099670 RepID=A0A955RL75_9BACT|nr:elongation factor Ts [Candidatus Dojkabacteria bacterium]
MATMEEIKKLRNETGAGINAVTEALKESKGDMEAARKYLRQKGEAKAEKRKDRTAANGILGVYIHGNNKVVTVVEVSCETDFAAKSEDMRKFANDLALQVAAANPEFLSVDGVSKEKVAELNDTFEKELEGKPENIKENILKGKMDKYYEASVLMKQVLFADDSKTVEDYLNEMVAKIGEKIELKSFSKFEVAQDVQYCSVNKSEEK